MLVPRMAPRLHSVFLLAALGLLLLSCAAPEVHVHDRHGLSYPVAAAFARSHPGSTLVLLDYHHDMGPRSDEISSCNWVGALLEKRLVSKVVWVSGRTLLKPNRESRANWLRRSLSGLSLEELSEIESRVTLADWADLRAMRLRGPLIVSLDLDLLTVDPGDPPERFLDELVGWTLRQRPGLVTVALSAAYQRSPAQAWGWLERFARSFDYTGARWFLESGGPAPYPESLEESKAWRGWNTDPQAFQAYGSGFFPGETQWIQAPQGARAALLARGVRAGDDSAGAALSGWTDEDRAALESEFPAERLSSLLMAAREGIESAWIEKASGFAPEPSEPPPGNAERGIALRLLNRGIDRGCLALYGGVEDARAAASYCALQALSDPRYPPVSQTEAADLELEMSVFGPWRPMNGPLDFRPGLDSVLVEYLGSSTLLQASLASERQYDRKAFLSVLAKKAGLGPEGWALHGLSYKRAATLWTRIPFSTAAQSQKKVKK